jgi:tetratricopeptide (TPR) repeat protein
MKKLIEQHVHASDNSVAINGDGNNVTVNNYNVDINLFLQILQKSDAQPQEILPLKESIRSLLELQDKADAPIGIEQAINHLQQGNTQQAEAIFLQIEMQQEEIGVEANKKAAEAARHRGALAYFSDPLNSLQAYRSAVRLDPENLESLAALADLLNVNGQPKEAEETYLLLKKLATERENDNFLSYAYNGLGIIHKNRGELNEAKILLNKALELDKKLDDKNKMASDYCNLGSVEVSLGNLDGAESFYNQALVLYQELHDYKRIADIYYNLGNVYIYRGGRSNLNQAHKFYSQALSLYQEVGAKRDIEDTEKNLIRLKMLANLNENNNK